MYKLSPGITRLSTRIQHSQKCGESQLFVPIRQSAAALRSPQTTFFIRAVWGWWHRAAISQEGLFYRILGLCTDCTTQERPWCNLTKTIPLASPGFTLPERLLFLFFIETIASRGLQHHILFYPSIESRNLFLRTNRKKSIQNALEDELGLDLSVRSTLVSQTELLLVRRDFRIQEISLIRRNRWGKLLCVWKLLCL